MKVRTLLLLVMLIAITAFALLNWSAIVTPTTLNLGFTAVQAPLGLVLLALLVLTAAVFLLYILYLQTSVIFDTRRHARELQHNRELADKAEASRFTELRVYLEQEFARQSATSGNAALDARLTLLEERVRAAVEESGNTLAAYIGELEDRLEHRGLNRPAS